MSLIIKLAGIYPVYSFVELNTKERGMITTINPATLHQPIVALTYDETGKPIPKSAHGRSLQPGPAPHTLH